MSCLVYCCFNESLSVSMVWDCCFGNLSFEVMKFMVVCCLKFGVRVCFRVYCIFYNFLLFFYLNYSVCVEIKLRFKIVVIFIIMKIEVRNLNVGVRI